MGINISTIPNLTTFTILTIFTTIILLPLLTLLICVGVWKYQEWKWIEVLRVSGVFPRVSLVAKIISFSSYAKDRFVKIWEAKDFPHNPKGFPHDFNNLFHSQKAYYVMLLVTFPQLLPLPFFYSSVEKIYHKFVKIYADLARKFTRLLTVFF